MASNNLELNKKLMEVIESEQDEKEKKIVVEQLIEQGANINWQDEKFATPLMKSISVGNDEITKLLLEKGAQVNIHNEYRFTALGYAASAGKTDIVEMLLNNGAKVNAKDLWGQSALHIAMKNGNKELSKLLINNGADYNAKDSEFFEDIISIPELLSKPENKDIRDLVMQKEEQKEQERLENRRKYIEELKNETKDTQKLQDIYSSKTIESYVDLKMGNEANIENLSYDEVDGLLELINRDKEKNISSNKQQEISEEYLKNELAKDTKVYVRGVENIAGIEKNSMRTHNEYGAETEIRKLARRANVPTLTKIKGVKTGNYNRCTSMVNHGKILPFRTVGYGIIKESIDGIKMASKYDLYSDINKKDDMIYRADVRLNTKENLPIKEQLDEISNHWKNEGDMKRRATDTLYNEVIMDVADPEVKFIYWTETAKNYSKPTYDKLQAVYFQKKYYEQTGRTLPIYEYKRDQENYLVETKFNNKDIVGMLKEELLDESGNALKPQYAKGNAVNFLMTFNDEISQIENSKDILKTFVRERLDEYSDKNNINNVWDVVNAIKYSGIIMNGEKERQDLKEKFNTVFNNILESESVEKFLAQRTNGARYTSGKEKSDIKDVLSVIELLSEVKKVAQDKTMDFLKPELEGILQEKIHNITKGIKTDIILPIKLKNALDNEDVNLMKAIIEQGIDINSQCIKEKTALMYAVQNRKQKAVTELLEQKNIDIGTIDNEGKTALMYAMKNEDLTMASKLFIKGLTSHVNDREGYRLFIDAISKYKTNAELEYRGINIDKDVLLPLAVRSGSVKLVDTLINLGADINAKDNTGKSLVRIAIEKNNTKMTKLLIEKGAKIDKEVETLLQVALKQNNNEIVGLLNEKGESLKGQKIEKHQTKNLTMERIKGISANNHSEKIKALTKIENNIENTKEARQNSLTNENKHLSKDKTNEPQKHKKRAPGDMSFLKFI